VLTILLVQVRLAGIGKHLVSSLSHFPMLPVSQNHLIDPLTARHTMPFDYPSVSRELRHHEPAASMTAIERPLLALIRVCRHSSFHAYLLP
jgi:hypothetical protein